MFLREINIDGGSHTWSFGDDRAAAEAELAKMRANGLCRECGDVLYDHYIEEVKVRINTLKLCHTCLFWTDRLAEMSDPTHVVINGHYYSIAPDKKTYYGFTGHGGAEFIIRFPDGREVVTHNLWAQGRVPEWFRERLPDTATFVHRGHKAIGPFAGYGGAGSADADCELAE